MRNNKWKKICSCMLAVCLVGTLFFANQSSGVFAEENEQKEETTIVKDEQQDEKQEDSAQDKENVSDADAGEKDVTAEAGKKDEEKQVTTSDKKAIKAKKKAVAVQAINATWTRKDSNIIVSGDGEDPTGITVKTGDKESLYKKDKNVIMDYVITPTKSVEGEFHIDISDCGIMSDDTSLEVYHITDDSQLEQIKDVQISEGKASFNTTELGEYIAVSNVATLDLAKDTVIVNYGSLEGKRQDGTKVVISFSKNEEKKYRITQSNSEKKVGYGINFSTDKNYTENQTIIIDGINTSSNIRMRAYETTIITTLLLRNINQVHHIFYGTGKHNKTSEENDYNNKSRLTINSYDKSGELYIPYKMSSKAQETEYVLTTAGSDNIGSYWSIAGIGAEGDCNDCTGLTIAGGKIKVLGQNANGATAIGGGGNGDAEISITGGDITAITSSTGAAIGGGIGWINRGGNAEVNISGGNVYAENIGYYTRSGIEYGGVAIGSGSSMRMEGNTANIGINGGNVIAYARYGNGIGSGNSYQGTAAKATINISGNNTSVTTNALGGGTSKEKKGGSAEINIKDSSEVNCVKYSDVKGKWDSSNENVLGAFGIGGGNSAGDAKGGNAVVNVSGGSLNCNGGNIGGGDAVGTGDGGDAAINVSGGILDCASIGGGASDTGTPGAVTSDTQPAGVVVSGGNLKAGTIGGGTNTAGDIGFATADISGGNIQGQFILSNTDSDKQCKFTMTGGTIDNTNLGTDDYKTAQENGGAVYLSDPNGEVKISGGTIQNSKAKNEGAVYMTAGTFSLSDNGIIKKCTAEENGGAVYLKDGTVQIFGGQIGDTKTKDDANKAVNGAGIYQESGQMNIAGGDIIANEASENGGGAYLAGGKLNVLDGKISTNTAKNGAGAYVADSSIRMFGGTFASNKATESGGGMYVSSTNKAADVVIRSGKLINNSAESSASDQGNGGAIAVVSSNSANADRVIIGLREKHPGLDTTKRTFTAFDYKDDKDDNTEHNHASCPEISGNTASGNGGGIYMSSSKSILDIYCLMEEKNTAEKDTTGGSIMSVGGNVNIGDIGNDGSGNNTKDAVGNIFIQSPMLVKGGNVKIYGNTDNPKFADKILVDMRKDAGTFNDYRYTMAAVGDNINYKIEYFENFEGSGAFTSMQYSKSAKITAMGNMYIHEGYKIVGWDTQADGKGTRYQIGNLIASADDHSAWNGKGDKEALRLYAIWEKVSYTVVYDPNAEKYSGKMPSEQFTYNVQKKLSDNVYKVDGKRFVNWNTKADGKGTTYESSYNESKMTNKDGATITLYAQWVECTHLGGDHPGNVSYTLDDLTHRILTETCDCGGHTASVAISGADVYYDGKEHLASLNYTNTFLAGNQQITYTYKANASDPSYGSMPEGTTVPKNIGYYRASITVKGQTAYVEYQIKSPAEAATIDAAAIEGQYFKNFNGKSACAVAKDDAFTVQYDVQKLNEGTNEGANKAYKTAPVLTLSQSLPEGTTVIMQTGDKYWYYQQSSGNSGTEIALSSFTKMGTTSAKFTYSTSNIENTQMYRFVVDFSKVRGVSLGGDLQIGLKYAYTNPTTGASETSQDKEKKIMVSLNDASVFKVSPSGNECTVTAPSTVTDTRWERKNLVWKIKPAKANVVLPSDAKLTLSTTEGGSVKTAIYALNTNGEFIIPFTWTGSQKFTFSLSSSQESAVKSYDLTANLCVGSKVNGTTQPKAQEDDLEKASADISLTVPVDAAPAVKITGVKDAVTGVGAERVFSNKDTLNVNITTANVDGCKIQAIIQKKADGTYKGEYYKSENVSAGSHSFSLQSTDGAGSYRLLLTVSSAIGQTLLEVPYYFIVQ